LENIMSLQQIEIAISNLPKSDLQSLADWLQEYIADEWDSRIEADIGDGNLTEAGLRADRHYESGRCTPLG